MPQSNHHNAVPPGHNPWLDVMRGLAIMLVLLRHGERSINIGQATNPTIFEFVAHNGWIGVDLFFVLSGYLIGRNLISLRTTDPNNYIKNFFARRFRRILPAYFAVLIVISLGLIPFYDINQTFMAIRATYHFLMLQDYLPANINVVFWSLGVEAKFYLLAPLILLLFAGALTRNHLGLLLMLLMLLLAIAPISRWLVFQAHGAPTDYESFWPIARSPFHACLEPLLLGFTIAFLTAFKNFRLSQRQAGWLLALSLAVIGAWTASYDFMAEIGGFDILFQPGLIAVLFTAAVVAAVNLHDVALPGAMIFSWLAKLSYCLYLVHYPLMASAHALADVFEGSAAIFWLGYLFLSFMFAYLLHVGVERPFLTMSVARRAMTGPR